MFGKNKMKRILSGLMAVLISINGFLPNVEPLKTYALIKPYGLCIDNKSVATNARFRSSDVFSPALIDLDQFTYGTLEYDNALEQNVQRLKAYGINESNALKLFWALVSAFYSNPSIANNIENGAQKVNNAIYWYNESINAYNDSVAHNYINPKIDQIDYLGLTELDVGQVLHGNQWQQKIQGRPLLAMLGEENTFMGDVADYGKGLNAVMPRLKRSWYESYQAYGEAASGYATWPVGSGATSFSKPQDQEADVNIVAQVALDMEKDKNYWENKDTSGLNSNSGNITNTGNINNNDEEEELDDIDADTDEEDDSEIRNNSKNSHAKEHYVINMTDTFYNNSGLLKIHDGNGWVGYSPLLGITTGATVNVKGWEILRLLY